MWCPLLSPLCVVSPVVSPVCSVPCCLPCEWDNMWCPPRCPPSRASSPPTVWCLLGGWDNMWCPPCRPPYSVVSPERVGQHVVSPVSSPPSASSPLQCGVSWEGGTTCGFPRVVPPFRVVLPTVWCLLEGWDNMWCPPRCPPLPRRPPYSVVSPGSLWCPRVSSPLKRETTH